MIAYVRNIVENTLDLFVNLSSRHKVNSSLTGWDVWKSKILWSFRMMEMYKRTVRGEGERDPEL
jgi:hypothetical protein